MSYDEQMAKADEMAEVEYGLRMHGYGACDCGRGRKMNPKTCGYSEKETNINGHCDDFVCLYKNNELNWCGDQPCPLEGEKDERN